MNKILILFISLLYLSACTEDTSGNFSATMGNTSIGVDEGFKSIIESELAMYHNDYKYANIHLTYASESSLKKHLVEEKLASIIIGEKLNAKEKEALTQKQFIPREYLLGYDALAIIAHKDYPDSTILRSKLEAYLKGDINQWNEIEPNFSEEKVVFVLDKGNSSNFNYINDTITFGKIRKEQIFAAKSNEEVINSVASNKYTLGVISANLISNSKSKKVQDVLSKVKYLGIKEQLGDSTSVSWPFQNDLALGKYPYKRGIYMISIETTAQLGTGFASYMLSDPGQRIMLREGLLPITVPQRLIYLK